MITTVSMVPGESTLCIMSGIKKWEGAKIGYPHFALIDGDNIRIANSDETMKIMGLK